MNTPNNAPEPIQPWAAEDRLMARIKLMDKTALTAWYVRKIGYNPWEDDPTITIDEVRAIVGGYAVDAFECRNCEANCNCDISL